MSIGKKIRKRTTPIIIITIGIFSGTATATEIGSFINNRNCDQIIDKGSLKICYDYNLKAARYVSYTLKGDLVNAVNIKKRPRFYEEKRIPKKYRATHSDYTHSGYDRGHIKSDADCDSSSKSLKKCYSLANIIPQAPAVNRRTWIKAEKYERLIATKLGSVTVINGVTYPSQPKRIGRNGIAVSSGFWKIIYNDQQDFKRCFYYKNDLDAKSKGDKLRNHLVDCLSLN